MKQNAPVRSLGSLSVRWPHPLSSEDCSTLVVGCSEVGTSITFLESLSLLTDTSSIAHDMLTTCDITKDLNAMESVYTRYSNTEK